MKFRKQIITLLGAVLLSSSVSTTGVASADTTDSNPVTNITNTNDPNQSTAKKTYKWTYPFKACDKYGVRPMFNAQVFGMTNYLRSVNPPSYFHDGCLCNSSWYCKKSWLC